MQEKDMDRACDTTGGGGRYTALRCRNEGKDCLEDLGIDGRIILK